MADATGAALAEATRCAGRAQRALDSRVSWRVTEQSRKGGVGLVAHSAASRVRMAESLAPARSFQELALSRSVCPQRLRVRDHRARPGLPRYGQERSARWVEGRRSAFMSRHEEPPVVWSSISPADQLSPAPPHSIGRGPGQGRPCCGRRRADRPEWRQARVRRAEPEPVASASGGTTCGQANSGS